MAAGMASTGPGQSALFVNNQRYNGPIGPSSPGYIQGTANHVAAPTQSVLDASTSIFHPTQQPNKIASTPQTQNTGQNNNNNSNLNLPNVDDIYNPLIDNLNNLAGTLNATKTQQLGGIDTQYAGQQQTVANQLKGLQSQLSTDQSGFGNQVQSAVAQAAKDYEALRQRNMSMFGGQSSAGGAADELLGQQYLTTRNGLANTQLQGNQQFQQEGLDINTWVSSENNKLDTWKAQAYNQINTVFQNGINQINQDKSMAQSAKAQAKFDLLNQVVQHQQALADYDTQLRGQLQAALAMSGANAGSFNAQPFNTSIASLVGGIPGQMNGLTSMAQMAGMSQQQAVPWVSSLGQGNNNSQDNQLGAQLQMAGFIPTG